jgi:hypothetical protein
MKTDEERRNEHVAFARLSPEKQLEVDKGLETRVKAMDDEIVSNRKAILGAEADLKRFEDETGFIQSQYDEARRKRQILYGVGKDTGELDNLITKLGRDIQDRAALHADRVAGTRMRISDLKNELDLLVGEKTEIERMLLEHEGIPLLSVFNKQIAEAMNTFEKIFKNQNSLDYHFHRIGGSRFTMIYLSDWEWLEDVGKLYLTGGIADEDRRPFGRFRGTWSYREFIERFRKKAKEAE